MSREIVTETPRLVLYRICPEDCADMFRWRRDEEVCRYMVSGAAQTPEELIPWLERQDPRSDERIVCVCHAREDGRYLGNVGMFYLSEEDTWSFAYAFCREEWNRGYASEATAAMMDYVRQRFHAHRFSAECARENVCSARVIEKCGLVPVAEGAFVNRGTGREYASVCYRLEDIIKE